MIRKGDFTDNLEALRPLGSFFRAAALVQANFLCALDSEEEIQMPPGTPELTICDRLNSQRLFLFQQLGNLLILYLIKLLCRDFTLFK